MTSFSDTITPPTHITFPSGFIWGASTSAYQIEGAWNVDGRGESIWDRFSKMVGTIDNNDNGNIACDHYHRYEEDVALMKDLGLSAYRFSISWPRVLPRGHTELNPLGLRFYHNLVDALLRARVEPWICLYHWDLPQELQDDGGWANPTIVHTFSTYAQLIAREFRDKVQHWLILNEPSVIAALGHLQGIHAPGIKDLAAYLKVSHNLLLAQGAAIQALRQINPAFKIGSVLNLAPVHPLSGSPEDQAAADRLDQAWNRWYLDPLLKGDYPPLARQVINPSAADMAMIHQPLEFLGLNYYQRLLVTHDSNEPLFSLRLVPKTSFLTEMGWEIYPIGLHELLVRLKTDYGNPIVYITENGAACDDIVSHQGVIQDDDRITYLHSHILAAYQALKAGVNLKGYMVWSLMDNFEWAKGYTKRFGLVQVMPKTLQRALKKSAFWYKSLISRNGIPFVS